MPGKEAGSGHGLARGDTGLSQWLFWSRPRTSLRGSRRRRVSPLSKQDRLNSKKLKAKDDKKPAKSSSRDRLNVEDPAPDIVVSSQEPIDPLVLEKYSQRMYMEVRARPRAPPSSPSHPFLLQMISAYCIHSGSGAALALERGSLLCETDSVNGDEH